MPVVLTADNIVSVFAPNTIIIQLEQIFTCHYKLYTKKNDEGTARSSTQMINDTFVISSLHSYSSANSPHRLINNPSAYSAAICFTLPSAFDTAGIEIMITVITPSTSR